MYIYIYNVCIYICIYIVCCNVCIYIHVYSEQVLQMVDYGRLMNRWENHSHKNYSANLRRMSTGQKQGQALILWDTNEHHFVASLCYTRSTASMSFNTSVETALPKATFFPSLWTKGSFNFESLQCHFGFLSSNQISLANRNVYVHLQIHLDMCVCVSSYTRIIYIYIHCHLREFNRS